MSARWIIAILVAACLALAGGIYFGWGILQSHWEQSIQAEVAKALQGAEKEQEQAREEAEVLKKKDICPKTDAGEGQSLYMTIFTAAATGDVETVLIWMDEFKSMEGGLEDFLHTAAENGQVEVVEVLLEAGADPNGKNRRGATPLFLGDISLSYKETHDSKYVATARALLSAGASVDDRDESGQTALHQVAKHGHAEVAEVLVEAKAEVNAKDWLDGHTPLHAAIQTGSKNIIGHDGVIYRELQDHVEVSKVLIDAGAQFDAKDEDGKTALHEAAISDYSELVRLLLDHGADIDAKDNLGQTPLFGAAWTHNTDVVEMLLAAGASVDEQDNSGQTPLHKAAFSDYVVWADYSVSFQKTQSGHVDIVGILLEAEAEINVKDNDGNTPLHEAARAGHIGVAEILLAAQAEIQSKNDKGEMASDIAIQNNHVELEQLLRTADGSQGSKK